MDSSRNFDTSMLSAVDDKKFAIEVHDPIRDRGNHVGHYQYEILTKDQIIKLIDDLIAEVVNVTNISVTTTKSLLHYYKWDKDRLTQRFCDDQDKNLFRINSNKNPNMIPESKKLNTDIEKCKICCADLLSAYIREFDCGHNFCIQCFTKYITTKIIESSAEPIFCPVVGCNMIVDDETVIRCVRDPDVKSKYQHFIINSFVECNSLLRWCPSSDCTYAIKVGYLDFRPVKCKCGCYFCFKCGENWHDPVNCRLLNRWIKKYEDYAGTLNRIAVNAKACPRCNKIMKKKVLLIK